MWHLVASVVAFITDPDEGAGPDVGVADDAAAVALLAQPADGHAGLLPAENQVGMVLCHSLDDLKQT